MIVTERFDYDRGRQVSVYMPPSPPRAIVFSGDGQLISTWGRELEVLRAPPTMIVGVHSTDDKDEMARLREYSPGFDAEQFSAHEGFLIHDVREWVRSKFDVSIPADRTIVAGASAGAELALALGLRHPEMFGFVFAASPGAGYRPPAKMPSVLPRTYLTAGTLEPFFLENAVQWADALKAAGAEVIFSTPDGGHGDPFWKTEFAKMVFWSYMGG
ncbi:alpha/beta hydrolase-fold protein [Devosia sp. UYZn731]|uniref:alpha/beta hydrolase n=1 Tax=Devosia sp. UYZn731 TaxID=3156345 RepID=UPI003395EAA5